MVVNVPRPYDSKTLSSPLIHRAPMVLTSTPASSASCKSAAAAATTAANLSNERFLMQLFVDQATAAAAQAAHAATHVNRMDRYAAHDDGMADADTDSPRVFISSATSSATTPPGFAKESAQFLNSLSACLSSINKSRCSVDSYDGLIGEEEDDVRMAARDTSDAAADVVEEIEGLEIGSDDSSAAADSDVDYSFQKMSAGHDDGDDDDGDAITPGRDDMDLEDCYGSPSLLRAADGSDCPLLEMRPLLDDTDEHPYICLEDQVATHASHKAQCLYDFCTTMVNSQNIATDDLAIAAKILVNEAHRLQTARHRSGVPALALGGMSMLPQHLRHTAALASKMQAEQRRTMWERVGNNVARDLYVEGHGFVQRRLSCMCIFSVTKEERFYHDNDSERMQRLARQERLLGEIQQQAMLGGNRYFLHPTA